MPVKMALSVRALVRAAFLPKFCCVRGVHGVSSPAELPSWSLTRCAADRCDATRHDVLANNSSGNISAMRWFSTSSRLLCEANHDASSDKAKRIKSKIKPYNIHPVETSQRYLNSSAYAEVYGDEPVWTTYRRNFKGQFAPRKTRESCVRGRNIMTGNPCPICRDEYLVVHHENTRLLNQFISPYTGQIYDAYKTGVCQRVQFNIELAIMKAYDLGLMEYEVPFRHYNYEEFYPQLRQSTEKAFI